jgi:hypothetical protein
VLLRQFQSSVVELVRDQVTDSRIVVVAQSAIPESIVAFDKILGVAARRVRLSAQDAVIHFGSRTCEGRKLNNFASILNCLSHRSQRWPRQQRSMTSLVPPTGSPQDEGFGTSLDKPILARR